MNSQGTMISRSSGMAVETAGPAAPNVLPAYGNSGGLLQRSQVDAPPQAPPAAVATETTAPEPKDLPQARRAPEPAAQTPKPQERAAGTGGRKPAAKPDTKTPAAAPITYASTPDALAQEYIKLFKSTLGLDLSTAICFENMRRICEIDARDPCATLYFLENTYRLSTLLYLADNLPIVFVASVVAENNRKNILKYVTAEIENGSKPYADLLALRRARWVRKYENMAVDDAMTVTPGATSLTPELSARMAGLLADTCRKLRKYNDEMTSIAAKFDDAARNDIVYIYSNWWYLLQGFENVPETRSYIMAVTDDTRRNLKI